MVENHKEFFCTEELHSLHPELSVREDSWGGQDYVVFSNPGKAMSSATPEWPIGIELWVGHSHEINVDDKIYDPLQFYFDRRGFTEDLTGNVYGQICTMTEALTQCMYGGYYLDVMFGEFIKLSDSRRCFLVSSPYDVELAIENDPTATRHIIIRIANDQRKCAISSAMPESCNFLYQSIQYSIDGFTRYDFLVYPLLDGLHSSRAQAITVKKYVHFYAAMYDGVIMLAHHNRARQSQ